MLGGWIAQGSIFAGSEMGKEEEAVVDGDGGCLQATASEMRSMRTRSATQAAPISRNRDKATGACARDPP